MTDMRAIELTAFGGPECLRDTRRALPEPQAGEVRIKVAAFGLNPIDFKTRRGGGFVSQQIRDHLPWVPGYDVAGIIDAAAPDTPFPAGTRVCGMINFPLAAGAYADHVVCRPDTLAVVPEALDLAAMAALPLAGLTAVQALERLGPLQGKRLLILGGGGGVGRIACQWALQAGAIVTATASASRTPDLLGLGVQTVLDYHDSQALDGQAFDLLLDLMGASTGIDALTVMVPQARVVTVPTITAPAMIEAGTQRGLQVQGITVTPDARGLADLVARLAQGQLDLRIEARYAASDIQQAHADLEAGGGKRIVCWT